LEPYEIQKQKIFLTVDVLALSGIFIYLFFFYLLFTLGVIHFHIKHKKDE